ncbi:MAG: heme NO-binding domain-containing protein [Pseudomonadota bacterium]
MNGLINRALQGFLMETYGTSVWEAVRRDAQLGFDDFEAMLRYETGITAQVAKAAAKRLDKSPAALLEDVGTFLIAHQKHERLRRLLRFGGNDFREFLFSLEDLPGRARMALPGLDVPEFILAQKSATRFELTVVWRDSQLAPVILGAVRAMADEYGALVLLELVEGDGPDAVMALDLLDNEFAEARSFELGEAAL